MISALRGHVRARPRAAVAVALAVACAAALAIWYPLRGETSREHLGRGPYATPRTAPDRVPPTLTELPKGCGLTEADLDALVPGGEPSGGPCRWRSSGRERRELAISDSAWPNTDRLPVGTTEDLSAYGDTPPRPVAGLGDSALAYVDSTAAGNGGRIVLVVRDAVFTVAYTAEGAGPEMLTSGALRAASAFARKAAAPAAPKLGEPVRGRLTPARPPEACGAVSAKALGRTVGRPLTRKSGAAEKIGAVPELVGSGCLWQTEAEGGERALGVTVYASPEREPGSGAATAARAMRMLHRGARGDKGPLGLTSSLNPSNFQPIAGLGDQAFGVYAETRSEGRVFFRKRNLVVLVQYSGHDEDEDEAAAALPVATAINGAYTVARDVERSL